MLPVNMEPASVTIYIDEPFTFRNLFNRSILNLAARIRIALLVKPPRWIRKLWPCMIWQVPVQDPLLYLTFDDGPVPGLTEWILDELDKCGAKATFFCVGGNVSRQPELYAKILASGHATGNHTFSHLNGYRNRVGNYVKDVYRADGLIGSRLFRPPYGRIRPRAVRRLRQQYHIILWDVLSMDYDCELEPATVLNIVISRARPGSIIVFHDNLKAEKNLKYVLPLVLDHFSNLGYRFLPLDENALK
jgi:peptidoglycan/xylan/chitin deacetylase (PgdA/CDA1 family)